MLDGWSISSRARAKRCSFSMRESSCQLKCRPAGESGCGAGDHRYEEPTDPGGRRQTPHPDAPAAESGCTKTSRCDKLLNVFCQSRSISAEAYLAFCFGIVSLSWPEFLSFFATIAGSGAPTPNHSCRRTKLLTLCIVEGTFSHSFHHRNRQSKTRMPAHLGGRFPSAPRSDNPALRALVADTFSRRGGMPSNESARC